MSWAYQYLPEVISAVEMETQDAVIRLETSEDSLGRVFIEHKDSGHVSVFSPLFCVEHFELIAQHMRVYHDKAIAEERQREHEETPEQAKPPVTVQPISDELRNFALK